MNDSIISIFAYATIGFAMIGLLWVAYKSVVWIKYLIQKAKDNDRFSIRDFIGFFTTPSKEWTDRAFMVSAMAALLLLSNDENSSGYSTLQVILIAPWGGVVIIYGLRIFIKKRTWMDKFPGWLKKWRPQKRRSLLKKISSFMPSDILVKLQMLLAILGGLAAIISAMVAVMMLIYSASKEVSGNSDGCSSNAHATTVSMCRQRRSNVYASSRTVKGRALPDAYVGLLYSHSGKARHPPE